MNHKVIRKVIRIKSSSYLVLRELGTQETYKPINDKAKHFYNQLTKKEQEDLNDLSMKMFHLLSVNERREIDPVKLLGVSVNSSRRKRELQKEYKGRSRY